MMMFPIDKGFNVTRELCRANRQRDLQGTVHTLMCDPVSLPRPVKVFLKPKDFRRLNKSHIRRLQAEHTLLKEHPVVPSKQQWMSARYDSVPPKVFDKIQSSRSSGSNNSQLAQSQGSSCSPNYASSSPHSSVISRSASNHESPKDYIKLNGKAAGNTKPIEHKKTHFEKLKDLPRTPAGKVPNYLLKRQDEWEMTKARAEHEKQREMLPKGCQLMDEKERIAILDELKKEKMEKEHELVRLPIRSDTLRAKMKRTELEKDLFKIDEHMELLSKPKVYIPIDGHGDHDRS